MKHVINLFLMDISHAANTSGVDRHISTLIGGLQNFNHICVHWIHFTDEASLLFPVEEVTAHYIKISIPLPQYYNTIIAERFWIRRYNEQVFRLTRHLFERKSNCIIHLHTLNLIDLAVYMREREQCKVITHLHCIPWKALYNKDKKRFNKLYELTYTNTGQTEKATPEMYVTNNCELLSYSEPDALICVTNCAADFLKKHIQNCTDNIAVIPNGIGDSYCFMSARKEKMPHDNFHCLYVGVLSESKGIGFILKTLRIVQRHGFKVTLSIAGTCPSGFRQKLMKYNSDLTLDIKGQIPFDDLKNLYSECDIGIISSVQEQASYVAIEMAMFGLPIITTAVDGLDEMFTDEVNALKVETTFSPILGLSVDIEKMALQLMRLICDSNLRKMLGRNARSLYEQNLRLDLMINKIVKVYEELAK